MALIALSPAAGYAAGAEPSSAAVRWTDDGLVLSGDAELRFRHADDILTATSAADLLVWVEARDERLLRLARFDGSDGPLTLDSLPLPGEAEVLCLGARGPHQFDLFVSDGDGKLQHFWLLNDGGYRLVAVRTLPVNPDLEGCAVGVERLYLLHPSHGIAAYARSEETDPVLEILYLPAPVGTGPVEPVALAPAARAQRLRLWDRDGRGWWLDTARTAGLRRIPAGPWADPRRHVLVPAAEEPSHIRVEAAAQTEPVASPGDAADDPLVLSGQGGRAWVVGTDKRWGLNVYALDGRRLLGLDRGRLNNVDGRPLSDSRFLLAASNRSARALDLFLADLQADTLELLVSHPLTLDDPYGLCMGRRPDGTLLAVVGGTTGRLQLWDLHADGSAEQRTALTLDSQTEGCVYDDVTGELYVGEERRGIWVFDDPGRPGRLLDDVAAGRLVADVEGLDLCRDDRGVRWLFASSQGDSSFLAYPLDRGVEAAVKFRIEENLDAGIDAVSETDGLACSRGPLPGFPAGVLVVQDGRKRAPEGRQNFKIVDWRSLPLNHGSGQAAAADQQDHE